MRLPWATYLDLGNCGLEELPDELFELVDLEVLILSGEWVEYNDIEQRWYSRESKNQGEANRLQELSPKLAFLKKMTQLVIAGQYNNESEINDLSPLRGLLNLQSLNVSRTQVSDLSPLQDLLNLKQLSVSSTQVSDLSPLQGLLNLQSLRLPYTQTTDLIPLQELENLQSLEISHTEVSDLSPLRSLLNLQSLGVACTQVSDLSPLQGLVNLQELYVYDTYVSDLSPLQDLLNLQTLQVHELEVTNLSPLQGLVNLKELYVSVTGLNDLSPLQGLLNLQELFVSGAQVSDLSPLKGMVNLHMLHTYCELVSDLSPLKDMMDLKFLDVSETQINDLSPLQGFVNLQKLNISSTQVSDLSPLQDLVSLQELNVSKTQINDLNPLQGLVNLQELAVSETEVNDLSPLQGLVNLINFFANDTSISDLSTLEYLKNFKCINVQSCPIQNIPNEIYDQYNCAKDLFAYWQALKTAQKVKNQQLKVMFLGNGCVGKSTLLHWFLNGEFTPISLEEGRTHGIFIKPYAFKNSEVLAHFWDFGGQEVFHATHRLFLGRRSLYVLVWATESPEFNGDLLHPIQYWLDLVADLTDPHERSRVLIVQNLFEGQKERNILSDEERAEYEAAGLEITTYCINSKKGDKVKPLLAAIEEEAEQLVNTYIEELPQSWVDIRRAVAERRFEGEKMLSQADFEAICQACNLSGSSSTILNYLHRAGELFYYQDHFENQIILDQEWALKAVYAILKRNNIEQFKGRIRKDQLIQMWQNDALIQSKAEAHIFLNFMKANNIAFYTENEYWELENPELVIPQLLPETPPKRRQTWEKIGEKTCHRIAYNFLHRDIIERFVVQTAHLSRDKSEDIWRNGLFIEYGHDDEALIEVQEVEGKKLIHIECVGSSSKELLQKIREEFNKIRILEKALEWTEKAWQWVIFEEKMRLDRSEMSGFEPLVPRHIFEHKNRSQSIKKRFLNAVAAGELQNVLEEMRKIEDTQSKNFQKALIELSYRFSQNERSKNAGTLSTENYQIERNQIVSAVIGLLDSDFDENEIPLS